MKLSFGDVARNYIDLGYSVLPILPNSKRPGKFSNGVWSGMLDWDQFAERFASDEELDEWEKWEDAGIGLLTGVISGVVAVDFDFREDIHKALEEVLPASPVRKVGAKGYTAFYKYNGEINQKWTVGGETVVEILSTGRQTLLPPTKHPSGMDYRWLTPDTLLNISSREDLPTLPDMSIFQSVFARFDPKYQDSKPISSEYRSSSNNGLLFYEDFERTAEAIKFISPDNYFTWVEVGMGIRSAFPDDKGLKLWEEWSKSSPKFKESECFFKWQSFANSKSQKRITVASIFRLASKNGWKDLQSKTGLYSQGNKLAEPIIESVENVSQKEAVKIDWTIPDSLALSAPNLTGKIVQWILETSIKKQPAIALGAALAFVGAIKGQRVCSPTDLRTNLYILGIALSGSGKQQPMKAIQQLSATVRGLEDLVAGEPTSDSGLLSLLKGDYGPKLIQWDEFGLALNAITGTNASTHSAAIMKWLNTMFSSANCKLLGKEYANIDGKMKRIDLNNPHLCVFGASAPGAFYQSLKSEHASSGFLPRFLIMAVEDNFVKEEVNPRRISDIPEDILEECAEIVNLPRNVNPLGNVDQAIRPRVLSYSDEAKELLLEKKEEYEAKRKKAYDNKASDGVLGIWSRATEHLIKIALTVSNLDEISFEAMQFGVKIVDQCLQAASDSLDSNVSDTKYGHDSQKCLSIIRASKYKGITQSELTKATQGIKRYDRDSVVKDLIDSGLIHQMVITTEKAGRPKTVFLYHEYLPRESKE